MFTGLVEGMVTVRSMAPKEGGATLILDLEGYGQGLGGGDSICIAGACLSAAGEGPEGTGFELTTETLAKTRFGAVAPGDRLNVERCLRAGAELGGHFVTGHVDGVGSMIGVEVQGDSAEMRFRAPASVAPYLVPKGSVAIEGVSLTVATLDGDEFMVALIPETLQRTTLGQLEPGAAVHMEGDLLGKYVVQHLAQAMADPDGLRRRLAAAMGDPA